MQIKELIKLANELDSRGLAKEADLLDKIAADILDFEERGKALRGDKSSPERPGSEPGELLILPSAIGLGAGESSDGESSDSKDAMSIFERIFERFVDENLGAEAEIYDYSGQKEKLYNVLHDESWELRDYMIETIPDKIMDLTEEIIRFPEGQRKEMMEYLDEDIYDPNVIKNLIIETAESRSEYLDQSSDLNYVVRAMKHYLYDYGFPRSDGPKHLDF